MNYENEIQRVCGNIKERVRACRSRQVAEMLKEKMCRELSRQCKSEIILNLLSQNVDKLIAETFDNSGNNLKLMEKVNEQNI